MNLARAYGDTLVGLTLLSADGVMIGLQVVDSVVCRLPFGRPLRDAVLDTILGHPEPFEYVSTTTPIGQTPPR